MPNGIYEYYMLVSEPWEFKASCIDEFRRIAFCNHLMEKLILATLTGEHFRACRFYRFCENTSACVVVL